MRIIEKYSIVRSWENEASAATFQCIVTNRSQVRDRSLGHMDESR